MIAKLSVSAATDHIPRMMDTHGAPVNLPSEKLQFHPNTNVTV